jgi:mannose-6-phosphate isomerase-like protein (cupin superfamily)
VAAEPPPLPGAVGLTHLRVYDTVAPDGLAGGTPHLHTVCTEAYWVVQGEGRVQTISGDGFAETPLEAGALVWFTPGTIHRLVNDSGDLEILVVMANKGLPEAGDMVVVQPPEVLADAERFRAATTLPDGARTTAGDLDPAVARRDSAVLAFNEMRRALERGDRTRLDAFLDRAAELVAHHQDTWRARWEGGPKAATDATDAHLRAIAGADAAHLREASVHRLDPPGHERGLGCCGTLGTYVAPDH